MELEYTRSGKPFSCNDAVGKVLMKRNLARYPTKVIGTDQAPKISPTTGKPTRTYTRRDLQAEK